MVKIIFQYGDSIVTGMYETEAKAQAVINKAMKNYPGIKILDVRSIKDASPIGKLQQT